MNVLERLPIDAHLDSFVSLLCETSKLVIVAPTGSGKSTRLPLWLMERDERPVLVVEPRRIACRALAGFLSEQIGESVGKTIGYRVRFESAVSGQTRVEFVTPGVALRLMQHGEIERYGAFLLDEFHERSWELDLLLVLLRLHLEKRAGVPLVLTSATIAGRSLASELGATLMEVSGRSYPVDIRYSEEPSEPSGRYLDERVCGAVLEVLRSGLEGDILVFLPGKREIDHCEQKLLQAKIDQQAMVLCVHASLPMQRLADAFAPKAKRRRIYLSTNVAETSLTLPGVTMVIDSGLARMRIHRGGRSALALTSISEPSMDQRSGRAGRVAPGRCLRLWKALYRANPQNAPEIERIELDDLLLQAGAYGLSGKAFDEAPWLTQPPHFAVDSARQRLRVMAVLDERDEITEFGLEVGRWPVSAQEASLLVGAPEGLAPTLADLVAILQQHASWLLPIHSLPLQRREELQAERVELLKDCHNEVLMHLKLLRKGDARRHHLHSSALRQARAISSQLRRLMKLPQHNPQADDSALPGAEELASWILSRNPKSGFVLRERARKPKFKKKEKLNASQPWGNGEVELQIDPFVQIEEDAEHKEPVAGVVLSHTWISDKGLRVVGRGRMLLPCKQKLLAEAGLGELELEEAFLEKGGGSPSIKARVSRTLAGICLSSEETALSGEILHDAAATLILEGRLFRGLGEKLRDELHVAALLSKWPQPREWEPLAEAAGWNEQPGLYLQERFAALGVQESEDLGLLEWDDLLPPLERWFSMQSFEMDDFRSDFPRIWSFLGHSYSCAVVPARRLVVLEPVDKKTHRAADPDAHVLPRFRGFRVDYQRASRRITLRK